MFYLGNIRDLRASASTPIQEWRKIILLVFLFLTATNICITAAPPTKSTPSAGKLEPVSIYFRWDNQSQFAGYYAAVKKGFYRQAGLEVTLLHRSHRKKFPKKNVIDFILESSGRYGVSNSVILLHRPGPHYQ